MQYFKRTLFAGVIAALVVGLNSPATLARGGSFKADMGKRAQSTLQVRMSERIKARAERGGQEMVDVIVRYRHKAEKAEKNRTKGLGGKMRPAYKHLPIRSMRVPAEALKAEKAEKNRIKGLGGKMRHAYKHLPMRSMRVPAEALKDLANNPNIELIAEDEAVQAFSRSARKTARLPEPGSAATVTVDPNLGIAVLDSGVSEHGDLAVQSRLDCTAPLPAQSESLRDEFNAVAWSGDDGTWPWSAAWQEVGEADGPGAGYAQVASSPDCVGATCLRLGLNRITGAPDLRFDKNKIFWDLTNEDNTTATISRIEIGWPTVSKKLKKVRLDGKEIYSEATQPPYLLADSDWHGHLEDRVIAPGQTAELKLELEKEAPVDPRLYSIRIDFAEGGWVAFGDGGGGILGDRGVVRPIVLAGSTSAVLSYDYRRSAGASGSVLVHVEASSDGGSSWTSLRTHPLDVSDSNQQTATIALQDYIALTSDAQLRFLVSGADPETSSGYLYVDNVQIAYELPDESCALAQAGGTPDASSATFSDQFDTTSYTNSDGSADWSAHPWIETGDDNDPDEGDITVEVDDCPASGDRCLEFDAELSANDTIEREVDLSGATSAILIFDYRLDDTGAEYVLEVSSDGGASWKSPPLATYDTPALVFGENFDLTPYIAPNTRIRFRLTDSDEDAHLYIDNLQIDTDVDSSDPDDPFGHGTHVAGVLAGDGYGSADAYPGVAPGARVFSLRVLDNRGMGLTSNVIAALDWVLEHADAEGIRVVNLSLGKAVEESAETDPLVQAAEAVWDAGLVVVASAGNYGRDGHFTITSPGNSRKLITVGSLTDKGTGDDFDDDFVSTYSSRGPTMFDHVLKPDLVAPGNRFIAPIPGKAKLKDDLPERVRCDDECMDEYLELSGTSMAAAMVSGTAALMLSEDPSLSPDTVKARLMRSARKLPGVDTTIVGAGVLDVEAALAQTDVMTTVALSPKVAHSEDSEVILGFREQWNVKPG